MVFKSLCCKGSLTSYFQKTGAKLKGIHDLDLKV